MITYSPANGFVGQDSFAYTLSDDVASAQGIVGVTVVPSTQQSSNQLSIVKSGPCAVIQFQGLPSTRYIVQSTDSLAGPWTDVQPAITADATGLAVYSDCNLTTTHFYRIRTNQ